MASRVSGAFARRAFSAARAPSRLSSPPLPRYRPPAPAASPRRSFSFSSSRNLGELGCMQSFLPLYSANLLTSHLNANLRAFCELSHGTFRRTCQDR